MDETVAQSTIYIPQGSTFKVGWPLTDADTQGAADTTGWKARCEVRTSYGGPIVTRFHTADVAWDGLITFDANSNLIMTLSDDKTALLPITKNAVFDVELIDPSGEPWRIIQGRAHVTPEATTDA